MAVNPTLLTDFRLGYYRYNAVTSKYDQGPALQTPISVFRTQTWTTTSPAALRHSTLRIQAAPASPARAKALALVRSTAADLNVNRCNCPLSQREDQYQIVNNWTKIFGNHSIKFGADLRYARNLRVPSDVNRAGQFNFGVGPTSSPEIRRAAWASRPLCSVSVTNYQRYASTSTNAKEFQKRVFFYAQDTWRYTPNLTLNLGLRYELYWPETVNGKGNGALMQYEQHDRFDRLSCR